MLMPNTAKGGGISRKIYSSSDRKKMKEIINDLELPKTMATAKKKNSNLTPAPSKSKPGMGALPPRQFMPKQPKRGK